MKLQRLIILVCLLITGCNENDQPKTGTQKKPDAPDTTEKVADTTNHNQVSINKDSVVLIRSKQVLSLLKNKNYTELAGLIHPVEGVRFSQYGFVDTPDNKRFLPDEFLKIIQEKKKLKWGTYDGTGDEILLTPEQYASKFVYDADFLHAEKTGVNESIDRGTMIDNQDEFYKNCVFTESFFSGFDKKYEGMDWRSLRLIFKYYKGQLFLVGIVHDQWTI